MKKKILFYLCLVLTSISLVFALTSCTAHKKQVPVYQGMSISDATAVKPTAYLVPVKDDDHNDDDLDDDYDDDDDDDDDDRQYHGDFNGKNDHIDQNKPFGGNAQDNIEDAIDDSLEVVGADKDIYYAAANQDIFVTIHINNPDSYEILSFTLNGQKYTNYMFEDGSNMENIILKYNVGDAHGIVEYTIDQIKYVDGTDIKDVKIEGDKTVRAGVRTPDQVTTSVTETIGFNDVTLNVKIGDRDGLFGYSEGKAYAVIYDGDNVLASSELKINDDNTVVFEDLKTNSLYQYAIVGCYDNLISGFDAHVLAKKAFYTQSIVLFDNIAVGKKDISFGFKWNEDFAAKQLTSLTLVHGETKTPLEANAVSASGLLCDNDYTLVAKYSNNGAEEEIKLDFRTLANLLPRIEIANITSTNSDIKFDLDIVDEDNVGAVEKIELLDKDGQVSQTASDNNVREFNDLDSYTQYTVKATFKYDLDDGKGDQTIIVDKTVHTKPIFAIQKTECINTEKVSFGDTIVLELDVQNPSDAVVKRALVNDKWYDASVLSNNKVIVNIKNDGQFIGGDTQLNVQKIEAGIGNELFTFETSGLASCFINGEIKVVGFEIVDKDHKPIDFVYTDEEFYFHLEFDNPTGYKLDSIEFEDTITVDEWTSEDNNNWYGKYQVSASVSGEIRGFSLKSYKYSNDSLSKENTPSFRLNLVVPIVNKDSYELNDERGGYRPISSEDDLKNIKYGYRYKLTADIALTGGWEPIDGGFSGILDGDGHTISNLNIVKTLSNGEFYLGLFERLNGVICNLSFDNVKIIVDVKNGKIYCGVIAADGYFSALKNVSVNGDIRITVDGNTNYGFNSIGGLIGKGANIILDNCNNSCYISGQSEVGGLIGSGIENITIMNSYNTGTLSGSAAVGGLIGSATNTIITNSYNIGKISGITAGGLVGYGNTTITSSYNTGAVSGNSWVGGLIGDGGNTKITNSYNTGAVSGNERVGGLIGLGSDTKITNSYNTGAVGGDNVVGGLVGGCGNITITNSYNTGAVTGNDCCVGGLVGDSGGTNTITNSYNTGKIIGINGNVGGLIGGCGNITITNSYNTGEIIGISGIGGLSGNCVNDITIINSYNIGEVSGDYFAGGLIGASFGNATITNSYYIAEGKNYGFIGNDSDKVTFDNCYHVSNGMQGFKLNSNQLLVSIISEYWDQNSWDFANTVDGINPSLKNVKINYTIPNVLEVIPESTFTFQTNGGTDVSPITAKFLEKAPVTKLEGRVFAGWYTDEKLTDKAVFPYFATSGTTLYARWYEADEQSEGLEIKDGVIVGIGNCTDSELYINMPVASYAFEYCNKITKVTFGKNVTKIGDKAFMESFMLKTVVFVSDVPPEIGVEVFGRTWDASDFTVYVPVGALNAYINVSDVDWQFSLVSKSKIVESR